MKSLLTNKKLFGILFIAWGIVILLISVIPTSHKSKITIQDSEFRTDYLIHFGIFLILGLLGLLSNLNNNRKKQLLILILCMVAFSSFSEILQLFIPSRTYNIIDLLSNISGIIFAGFLFYFYKKNWLKPIIKTQA